MSEHLFKIFTSNFYDVLQFSVYKYCTFFIKLFILSDATVNGILFLI